MDETKKPEPLPHQLSRQDVHRIIKAKVHRIDREFTEAFEFINKYDKSVTFFGSARFDETNSHYQEAKNLAKKISDLGYTILTGGGGGIMEAANRGAFEAGNQSLGLNIRLPKEQTPNSYTTDSMEFDYFFARKVALSFAAEAYIFFPGGFGTLDEMFEILTLIQTRKIHRVPIILAGRDFWGPLDTFIKNILLEQEKTIDKDNLELYTIADSDEEIIKIISEVPVRKMIVKSGKH